MLRRHGNDDLRLATAGLVHRSELTRHWTCESDEPAPPVSLEPAPVSSARRALRDRLQRALGSLVRHPFRGIRHRGQCAVLLRARQGHRVDRQAPRAEASEVRADRRGRDRDERASPRAGVPRRPGTRAPRRVRCHRADGRELRDPPRPAGHPDRAGGVEPTSRRVVPRSPSRSRTWHAVPSAASSARPADRATRCDGRVRRS